MCEMCTQNRKKVVTGVYGGSFNPIHIGHTRMAREVVARGLVDELWLVVSPQNPLKGDGLWEDAFRLELAKMAVVEIDGVEVSDVEFHLPKPNYMFTTLQSLSDRFPDREFVLIIGMDNWECFVKWYRWQDILQNYRLIVLPRQSFCDSKPCLSCVPEFSLGIEFAEVELVNISSSWIRSQMAEEPSYNGMGLLPAVWKKIKEEKR